VSKTSPGRTPPFKGADGRVLEGSVAEAGMLPIGGIDQWVLIRGRSRENPLLIVLHGGPGGSETAFFRHFNAALEAAFTVVYWDQRGAGRSYSKSIAASSLTVERFVADLDELVDAMLARFGKRQVVLLGHSWGTVIGTLYASRFPAKVAAYVGTGQVADATQSEVESYAFVLAEAERRNHRTALKQLRQVGPPPHTLKTVRIQRRWLAAFGGALRARISPFRQLWLVLSAPEGSPGDLGRLMRGGALSINALLPAMYAMRLDRDCPRFEVPIFFFLGRYDMQVAAPVSAAYFDTLEAPHKQLLWFEGSAHSPPFEEPELFNRLMIETVRPFAL
jgi:pimeloyl-ACP methyl ester carboxylesterase